MNIYKGNKQISDHQKENKMLVKIIHPWTQLDSMG